MRRQTTRSRRHSTGWFLLGLAVALSCAGSPADDPASEAPEPFVLDGWRRAEHHGLVLYTDTSEAIARRAFRQLSRFLDFVSWRVYGRSFQANRRLEVFVFGSRREYLRFAPEYVGGHAVRGDDENMTALSIGQIFEGTGTLYHELVHVVLHNAPELRFPSWYHEGLAVFFGTSVLRGDVLTVGGLAPERVQVIRRARPLPLRRLLSSPLSGQPDASRFYADAWAFVHFGLLSKSFGGPDRRDAFATFVSRVSRGESWEPAFLAAFGATPEEIAEEYERHRDRLARTKVSRLTNIALELDEPAAVFEAVERLQIARELGQLGLASFDIGSDSSAQLFDLILAASPNDPEAIHGRIRVAARRDEFELGRALWSRLDEDQRSGTKARQAEADLALARVRSLDPGQQTTVGAEDLERAIAGYERVLAEAPDRFSALVGLGQALVLAKNEDPEAGISALERAVEMSPSAPGPRLDLAELLIRSSAKSAAVPHLDFIVEAYPGSPFAKRAKKLRRRSR